MILKKLLSIGNNIRGNMTKKLKEFKHYFAEKLRDPNETILI